MVKTIDVLGMDPAFRNWGYAFATIDLDTYEITPSSLMLVQTEVDNSASTPVVDMLRRGAIHYRQMKDNQSGVNLVFTEVAVGSQSAKAACQLCAVAGIVSTSNVPLIPIKPRETKLASVGKPTATKKEMIEWAYDLYPDLNWLRLRDRPDGRLLNDNEHLADALAVIHAGVESEQFHRLMEMYR